MAVQITSPHTSGVGASALSVQDLLRAYDRMLTEIDESGPFIGGVPRWLVRTVAVRHVADRVQVLRRRAAARSALGDDPPHTGVRGMLADFAESLPATPRTATMWPLAIIGVLLAAWILANFVVRARSSTLIGDLTTDAVTLDRKAAIDAVSKSHLEGSYFIGGVVIVLWSIALVALPVAAATNVMRRRLARGAGARETAAFATLGLRPPGPPTLDRDVELVLPLSLLAIAIGGTIGEIVDPSGDSIGAIAAVVAILAIPGLLGLSALLELRRADEPEELRRHRWARRAVWAVSGLALVAAILSS